MLFALREASSPGRRRLSERVRENVFAGGRRRAGRGGGPRLRTPGGPSSAAGRLGETVRLGLASDSAGTGGRAGPLPVRSARTRSAQEPPELAETSRRPCDGGSRAPFDQAQCADASAPRPTQVRVCAPGSGARRVSGTRREVSRGGRTVGRVSAPSPELFSFRKSPLLKSRRRCLGLSANFPPAGGAENSPAPGRLIGRATGSDRASRSLRECKKSAFSAWGWYSNVKYRRGTRTTPLRLGD